MPILYTTKASATGGRQGHARSEDGKVDVQLDTPKELGGGGGPGTNPEQLFAAGYSACYLGALKFAANQQKVKISDDAKVTTSVGIGPREDGGGFGLAISMEVSLPGVDRAKAEELVKAAHVVCPYSHAIRGNHEVKTTLV
ncbi:organic hydroperoxide resistance protein [Geminicoccus harenae]|uniref:organic hydroperoxide resistance protein n=1 Tax=Geminicoccus harenae TaxID=2498453 RepID=UPI00168A59F0|nr:organic hydroperoxide resistance protein [Geminicoccus harenae]